MFINLCPFTIGMKNPNFGEMSALAVKYGFGGLDFLPWEFNSTEQAREAGESIKSINLEWGLLPLPCDFLLADDSGFSDGLRQLEKVLPIARAAGCKRAYNHIWPGNDSRQYDENFKWHVTRLRTLVDLLSSYDVRLGIEFIGPKTLRDTFRHPFIYNLRQAVELADAVSPKLGVVLDCFHWYTSGGTLEDIKAAISGDRIVNVHANDATPGRSREQQQDLERQLPMAGGLVDSPAVLQLLNELGYDGPVICEPFNPTLGRFGSMSNDSIAAEVSAVMKELFRKGLG